MRLYASDTLVEGGAHERYAAYRAFDGKPATCWIAGGSRGGVGEKLTLTLNRPITAEAVKLMPDFYDEDNYFTYGRIRLLKISIDSGRRKFTLPAFADEMKVRRFDFPTGAAFEAIEFTIEDVVEGDDIDNACLSEVSFVVEGEQIPISFAAVMP